MYNSLFNKKHLFLRTPTSSCNFIYSAEAVVRSVLSKRCSLKKNFEKFTGKHLCQSLLFNKAAGPVNFAKFLNKNTFLHRTTPVADSDNA